MRGRLVLGQARTTRLALIESLRRATERVHDDHLARPEIALDAEIGAARWDAPASDVVADEVRAA